MLDALVTDILPSPIVVPEGKFAAPGDFQIQNVLMMLYNRSEYVPLIRQIFPGNCAEYTTLDSAIILSKFGVEVNGAVLVYMDGQPNYNIPTVENDLTIPLVLQAQEEMKTKSFNGNSVPFPVEKSDVENVEEKTKNPYEPLSNTNSALFFRKIVSPKDTDFQPDDFVTSWSDAVGLKLVEREVQAIFIGSGDHATSILKFGDRYIYINPFSQEIVREQNLQQAQLILIQSLSRPRAFVTFNDVRM